MLRYSSVQQTWMWVAAGKADFPDDNSIELMAATAFVPHSGTERVGLEDVDHPADSNNNRAIIISARADTEAKRRSYTVQLSYAVGRYRYNSTGVHYGPTRTVKFGNLQ